MLKPGSCSHLVLFPPPPSCLSIPGHLYFCMTFRSHLMYLLVWWISMCKKWTSIHNIMPYWELAQMDFRLKCKIQNYTISRTKCRRNLLWHWARKMTLFCVWLQYFTFSHLCSFFTASTCSKSIFNIIF